MAPLNSPSIYYSARRFDAVNSIDRTPANTADIVASGALIWRMRNGALEVLIIHRPRYDDWSWPKGKQDPGESLAETAIREIREEVGLQVILGVPLAVTAYPVGGRPKDVFYWAAELPDGARALADEGEVDELRWVTTDVARALLTNQDDLAPLESLEALAEADALRTHPILSARHALFQFYVHERQDGVKELSCQLYQRSADMFLGVPFNIASYALLTYLIAQEVGMEPGEFVWTGGDCHIYSNHLEQVKKQLGYGTDPEGNPYPPREPYPYPKLVIKTKKPSIFDYEYEDFELVDYKHHPGIAAPIAV